MTTISSLIPQQTWYHRKKSDPSFVESNKKRLQLWRKSNPKKYLVQLAKARAKERKVDFDLKEEDLQIPETCPVLNVKFDYGNRKLRNSLSIDRIDPNLGYTKDNVQIISWKADAMKQDASKEELLKFAKWVNSVY
mgnify:FL=1